MFRSDDGGANWQRVSDKSDLLSRAWYYTHVTADPQQANTVYVNNLKLWKSTDGGRNYDEIGTPHGDNHDLWIDPADNSRMIQGNDGGANVSYNAGITWSTIYNQPTGQIYRLATDNATPYNVYGTQQDNSSLRLPSRSHHGSITWQDCVLAGSAESGWVAPDPKNPDVVYVGAIGSSPGGGNSLQRYDHKTRQIRLVTTWPRAMRGYGDESNKYRFAWTYPILFSQHDKNKLFAGGNHLFQTTDEGQSWQIISPDLTLNDPDHQKPSGGPINREPGAAETYGTIFALAESHFEAGVLWAGSDDGLIHLTKDGGESWNDITPPDLPKLTMIHCIEASPNEAGGAYMAATRYKLDDYAPYLFKTSDYGATWQRIDAGIPRHQFTRVIRADPERSGLLFAGTETGLYLSFDDGENWRAFQLNLPVAPIYDLRIKDGDLVAATHGRAFWILDDISPLRQMEASMPNKPLLFQPRDSVRVTPYVFEGAFKGASGKNYMSTLGLMTVFEEKMNALGVVERAYLDSGENPPKGAIIVYYLDELPDAGISLTFVDEAGETIRVFRNKTDEDKKEDGPYLPAEAGWNRFVWDLQYAPVSKIDGEDAAAQIVIGGALVAPGKAQVILTAGEQSESQTFSVVKDPMADASEADLAAQSGLWRQITQKCEEAVAGINQMRDVREQLAGWQKRLKEDENLARQAKKLCQKTLEIEEQLAVPDLRPGWTDGNNRGMRLLEQLAALSSVVSLGDYRPTDQAVEVFEELSAEVDDQLSKFNQLAKDELSAFNKQAQVAGIPNLIVI